MDIRNTDKISDLEGKNCDELITINSTELKRLYKKINEYQIMIELYQKEIKTLYELQIK